MMSLLRYFPRDLAYAIWSFNLPDREKYKKKYDTVVKIIKYIRYDKT